MIQATPKGHASMTRAVTGLMKHLHLYVFDGELKGYGYAPVALDESKWEMGVYPDVLWRFDAGEKTRVLGYYVTGEDGSVMYSEAFGPSDENEDSEPGFVIGKQADAIVVGLRLNVFVKQAELLEVA